MNMLTPSRLYCPYPDLFAINENLLAGYGSSWGPVDMNIFNFGIRTYWSTKLWHLLDRPCGDACSGKWRVMKGLVGFCVLNWSGIDSINDCATGVLVRDELAHSTYL